MSIVIMDQETREWTRIRSLDDFLCATENVQEQIVIKHSEELLALLKESHGVEAWRMEALTKVFSAINGKEAVSLDFFRKILDLKISFEETKALVEDFCEDTAEQLSGNTIPSLSDSARDARLARLVELLASQGNSDAQFQMGLRYLYGLIDRHDTKKAYEMLAAAHESGNVLASFFMYKMMKFGLGIGISYDGADEMFAILELEGKVRQLADEENPDAMFALGEHFYSEILTDGLVTTPDNVNTGLLWHQRAMMYGHTLACREAGFCRYLLRNRPGAQEIFDFAISQGDKAASFGLAVCLSFDRPRNDERIIALFSNAAEMGNPWAYYYLASVWNVSPESNYIECAKRMLPDANNGYLRYQEILATMFAEGLGVEQDCSEAYRRQQYVECYKTAICRML